MLIKNKIVLVHIKYLYVFSLFALKTIYLEDDCIYLKFERDINKLKEYDCSQ